MNINEFNKLEVGDVVYLFEIPNIHYYFSFNDKIESKTIDFILETDDDGNNVYAFKEGGILYSSLCHKLYLNYGKALVEKLKIIKEIQHNEELSEKIENKIVKLLNKYKG